MAIKRSLSADWPTPISAIQGRLYPVNCTMPYWMLLPIQGLDLPMWQEPRLQAMQPQAALLGLPWAQYAGARTSEHL